MANFISAYMDQATLDSVLTNAQNMIALVKDKAVKVSDEKKIGVRTMAEGREGYSRLVSKIATQHINELSRVDNPKELETTLNYDAALESVFQALKELHELIADTKWANSADAMQYTDHYVQTLETQRSNNSGLDSALRDVDDYNSRFGGAGNTTPESTGLKIAASKKQQGLLP